MDAIDFIKKYRRYYAKEDKRNGVTSDASFYWAGVQMLTWNISEIEALIENIEEWAKEHPAKTRQDIYLEERIPSSLKRFATITPKVDSNGALDLCPADVYCEVDCKLDSEKSHGKPPKDICDECHKIFWLREVE